MPPQSLEERILELCRQAVLAQDDEETQAILDALKRLLHEHTLEVNRIAVITLAKLTKGDAA
jgi:hypothetical protein